MDSSPGIITPIPKMLTISAICLEGRSGFEERGDEGVEKSDNPTTARISTPPFPLSLIQMRNSAFSIYDPTLEDGVQNQEKESQEVDNSASLQQKRVWKRQKKDKRELSRLETKNLNRYFRSKINEMLRDIKENPKDQQEEKKAEQILDTLNQSNKIMFSEIREIIKDKWLQKQLTTCSGGLLKYIHGGKMGMQSKLIMLKYFNKILKAIRNPENFTCWK